jgi:hypothetical protein
MAKKQEQVEQKDPIVEAVEGADETVSIEEPQEEVVEQEMTEAVDWEAEAKKFQSMYDKKTVDYENQSRENAQLSELRDVLESNPNVVSAMEKELTGQSKGVEGEEVSPETFDPWDAYYKKDSPSYKMRVSNEQKLVHDTVDRELGKLQQAMAINNLKTELVSKYKLGEEEASEFIEFATTPRGNLPVETLVKVWKEDKGGKKVNQNKEAVQKAKSIPKPAGVLQGGEVPQKDETEQVWDRIMGAGSKSKIAK